MKRIKAASITQTIIFARSENEPKEYAKRKENGSVVIEILKECGNQTPVGTYLD